MRRSYRYLNAALVITVAAVTASAQNLITNPGFESGLTGWSTIWSRTAGAATATVVSSPVHGGVSAAHIHHTGAQDWSFSPSTGFPLVVRPGQFYEYSAWVRVDSLASGGDVQISTVEYDSSAAVLNWAYAPAPCSLSTGSYRQYTTRFVVVEGVKRIAPRIIGDNHCDIYIDDFSLTLVDSLPAALTRPYVLTNSSIRVAVDPLSFTFDIRSLSSSQSYVTEPVGLFQTRSLDSTADSLVFHCTFLPGNWPVDITVALEGPAVRLTMQADAAQPLASSFVFPGAIPSGDSDQIVIGKGTGIIMPTTNVPWYLQRYCWHEFYAWQSDISLVGVTDMNAGYAIAAPDPWFTSAQMTGTNSSAALAPHIIHEPAKHQFGKSSRTVYLAAFASGGYVAMAQWYRTLAEKYGWVRTLAQKQTQAPAIAQLTGAVDWWNVGTGFWSSNATFYRNLRDYGIDRAIVNGGMTAALVDTLNTLGFLTSTYDCYCDAYPPGNAGFVSDGYNVGAIVKEDGSYQNGWLAYLSNGDSLQAQEVCAAEHSTYAIPRVTAERATTHLNCRFIDVELATGLLECWSTVHPVNRYSDALARVKLFDTLRTRFSLVLGGEQARDFAFPDVDYGEGTMGPSPPVGSGYDWDTPVAPDSSFTWLDVNPAVRVPLHGLIYHDVHIPTWYTGDGVSKVPARWDDKDLFNILYASMPLFMPPDTGYWRTNFERFLTSYNLVSAVNRGVGFAKMTDHAFVTANRMVQRTAFDNGWTVLVNFDSVASYATGGSTLPPKGFLASGGGYEVSRTLSGGTTVAAAQLADRLFVNSYGTPVEVSGVRSIGAVFLRRDSLSVHLAFVGSQSTVEFNPSLLPWPMAGVAVFASTGAQMTLDQAGNGWLRLTRLANVPFYRIEGAFAVRPGASHGALAVYSVRALTGAGCISVAYATGSRGPAVVDIIDLCGRTVLSQRSLHDAAGYGTVVVDARRLADCAYIVRLRTPDGEHCARVVWRR